MVSRAVLALTAGSVASAACTLDSMDCDLVCSAAWIGKRERAGDDAGVNKEECHGFGKGRRLHHDCGQLIDAAHDFGKLAEHGLEFFHAGVQGCGAFKFQAGRCLLALCRYLPHQRVAAAVEVRLHPGDFAW